MKTTLAHPIARLANRRLGFSRDRLPVPILFLFWISSQGCIPYLFHIGKEQAKIVMQKRPFEEVLSDPSVSEKTKEKLKEVERIRDFGIRSLALSPKGGFKSFVSLDRNAVGWHVSACHPLRFESYTWWFPIVGSVPYKGYFSLEKAKEEETRLKEEGWETRVRITAGYSTLGWFEDPLFSPQLYDDRADLSALVLHEMAHATVYFPGDSVFNESYASFVEEIGTKSYLFSIGGRQLVEARESSEQEREQYKKLLHATAESLKNIYSKGGSDEQIRKEKSEILSSFKTELGQRNWRTINGKKLSERDWNNEDFIGLLRYHSGSVFFERKFQDVGRDFGKFHEEMRKLISLSSAERKILLDEEKN
ncbi:putative aminopeptidase [Leptospira broomii serovar Hurstbridge str. 5399]|uniref:Aminopeptidase n=1 Tax=Leptospira broomii serovar Hurstbridge str. 5399 TaxID=1049789 RepID=T0GGD8_9LEPT|nr:aminopeptidase [Leptospira broomii]EQA44463.1 putative aminopeptidase [Leptospira broomii serovar Hurstbridge str. 5399]